MKEGGRRFVIPQGNVFAAQPYMSAADLGYNPKRDRSIASLSVPLLGRNNRILKGLSGKKQVYIESSFYANVSSTLR